MDKTFVNTGRNGRMEVEAKGASNTFSPLTKFNTGGIEMAKESLPNNFRTINLSQGQVAIIDAEDYESVSQFKWSAVKVVSPRGIVHYYGYRTEWLDSKSGKQRRIMLHRFILEAPKGLSVDHINRDSLDCRRSNMRLATSSQNNANRRSVGSKSGYRGVFPESGKYVACLNVNKAYRRLGMFSTAEEAARAYDAAATEAFGEFAVLNFG